MKKVESMREMEEDESSVSSANELQERHNQATIVDEPHLSPAPQPLSLSFFNRPKYRPKAMPINAMILSF